MTLLARPITQPELWCDTSQTLTLAHYQFLAQKGFRGCFRYLPLGGSSGGITLTEIDYALSVKCPDGAPFSLMFVQFGRSTNINAATGAIDGQALAAAYQSRGIPPVVTVAQDLSPAALQACVDYCHASYNAAVAGGIADTAVGMYAEPGYPLTAEQRYTMLPVQRYWATAANDPNRFVAHRGCQILQLWGSSRGEYSPEPGLLIDADVVQSDYLGSWPVAVVAG